MGLMFFSSCDPTITTIYKGYCGGDTGVPCAAPYTIYRLIIDNVRSPYCWEALGEGYYPDAVLATIAYDASYSPYESCNECLQYNYKLVNCLNSDVIYTNYLECPSCFYNINQLMYTNVTPNPCWYVTVIPEPLGPITTVIEWEGYCDSCEPKCYTVTGTGVITYFYGYGELITTNAPAIICSRSYPSVTGTNNEIFTTNNFCDNDVPCAYYYRLTNCVTEEQILSDEPDLAFPYALNETVKLAEYPGACWTIEQFPIVN